MWTKVALLLGVGLLIMGIDADTKIEAAELDPPVAKAVPKNLEAHGHVRVDDYYWLRERENPEVIDYLNRENDYTEAMMDHTKGLRDTLFEEIKGRIKQTDLSVPYRRQDFYYYSRTEDGKQYAIYCRKPDSLDAPEEIMVDTNILATGHDFFSLGNLSVSQNQNLLAYAQDTVGRRKYSIYFKNLTTGELLDDVIEDVTPNMAWANDNKTLFYTKQDPETLRSYRIYRHVLGTDSADDALVYEERDETFSCYVFKTKSRRYLIIGSSQTLSDEYRILEADNPDGEFRVFTPRERNHEHNIDHRADHFYIRTNKDAKNFRIMRTPEDKTGVAHWEEVVEHQQNSYIRSFELFNKHMVVEERRDALIHILIIPFNGSREHYLKFDEPAYTAYVGMNPEMVTGSLRFGYTSLTTPSSVFDYNMETREKTLLKQEEVLGGFSTDDYVTDRLKVQARDGKEVPVSIVYRKGTKQDGKNPLLLYAYGSYGSSTDASFSSPRLSLIDRGFVYAIAHIRGGQEKGRSWYEDGKLLNKMNTFTDFVDVGRALVEQGYTSPDRLYATGGSAGGLLMGAVINLAPELFHGIVTRVPFVDVVTTMLDEDIPLTTSEYDEWGNPNDKEYYDYIFAYSPYDQVEAKDYPHMLVTTGLHDSQVQYWEPAKWVAKLRAMKTDDHRLLLKTNMDAGHGGASGRYKQYEETAYNYAFILDLAGVKE
jgi:oligopeptidase B